MKTAVLEELRVQFRPEFLNRVDEVIVFHALSEEHLKDIVEIQLGRLRHRLAERHITLELTDRAKTHLVQVGHDPAYGARPLKRAIQKEIEELKDRGFATRSSFAKTSFLTGISSNTASMTMSASATALKSVVPVMRPMRLVTSCAVSRPREAVAS